MATRVTTMGDVATPTVLSAPHGNDLTISGSAASLSQAQASGVTAASLVALTLISAACIYFAKRLHRVSLWFRSGWDDSTSQRQSLRRTMPIGQLPRCDVEAARDRDILLHRRDCELRGEDEQIHWRAFEEHQPDPSLAGYRRNSRLVSELSLRDKDTEDQSSNLEAIEITDEIGTLADHALTTSEVRHPVAISSACGYSPN